MNLELAICNFVKEQFERGEIEFDVEDAVQQVLKSNDYEIVTRAVEKILTPDLLLAALPDKVKEELLLKLLNHNKANIQTYIKDKLDTALADAYVHLDDAIRIVVNRTVRKELDDLVAEKVSSLGLWKRLGF